MSRRDAVFQAYNAVQNHVYEYIDNHPQFQQQQQHHHQSSQSRPSRPNTSSANGPLPIYGAARSGAGEPIPDEVLYAAPGQAQRAADQLPMSRMARGDARDARRAAAAIRKEQLKNGQLKNRHTFASSNGRIVLDIFSAPQKTLTYVGGSADRGTGAMRGKVIVHAQEGDRISAIRLKIKAVATVIVPKSGTPQAPFQLDSADPSREPTSQKEILLLQLESRLFSTPSSALPAGSTSNDPTLFSAGTYEYPFSIDIPSTAGKKGQYLPPSFVLTSRNAQTRGPSKGGLFKLPIPSLSSDWASVKWYAKLTVERPGMFRANDRVFAPFVYLPCPPNMNGIEAHLERRHKLATDVDTALRRFHAANYIGSINYERLTEAVSTWEETSLKYGFGSAKNRKSAPPPPLANEKSEEGVGFFSRLLFGSQVDGPASISKEVWTFAIPKRPHVYPLRSGIPFVLSRTIEWRGQMPINEDELSKVPYVVLLQRANVYSRPKGPIVGTTVRLITDSRQTPATRPSAIAMYEPKGQGKSQFNKRTDSWLGIIDLPACTPCFETPILTLDYFLSVRVGAGQSIEVLHSEPVVICCPTPRPTQILRPKPSSRNHSTILSPPSRKPTKSGQKTTPEKKDLSRKQIPTALLTNTNVNTSPRPGPSRSRPPAVQASIPPAIDEKRAQHQHTTSAPSSRSHSPQIPPATPPSQSLQHSRAPSEAGTNDDDDEEGALYNDDELIDLPPSYYEATQTDNDD